MAKVMIVDDSVVLAKIAANTIQKAGHEVILAADGQEALDVIHEKRPDLIFLDAEMPVMDGWETCGALKADESTKGIPVLMCTGDSSDEYKQKAKNLGAVGYIVKPYKTEEIIQKISEILGI